ncbi:MAG: hypothetical protein ACLFNQ_05185 [Spirochaetaceae bacterium]
MRQSKVMKERIRRVNMLFRELGYECAEGELVDETYTTGVEQDGFQAGVFIDRDSKFLEIAFSFSFSASLEEFVRGKFEELFQICYEFGCYTNVQSSRREIVFSVFSKVYYAGLNYFSLKETVRDFRMAVDAIAEALDIRSELGQEDNDGTAQSS